MEKPSTRGRTPAWRAPLIFQPYTFGGPNRYMPIMGSHLISEQSEDRAEHGLPETDDARDVVEYDSALLARAG